MSVAGSAAAGWVLVLNTGSSSVKLALVDPVSGERRLTARVENVDSGASGDAVAHVLGQLGETDRPRLLGVGHRLVHGGERFSESVVVDDDVLAALGALTELAPLHMPANLEGIAAARRLLPDLPHVAVFDTAFHQTMPPVAYRYAVPQEWYDRYGVRRYGFHGTSHRWVSDRAAELLGRPGEGLRLVTLHLGNGCSAAAVRGGRSIDTTMGLTPLEGLVMGTRSGDVDPGLVGHLSRHAGLDAEGVVEALNTRSGLLGLSGASSDMRELSTAASAGSAPARLAVDVFCYRAAKTVGALAVALDGLDAVVFTAGIGEHAAGIRAGILDRLGMFGLRVDPGANADSGRSSAGRISLPGPVTALVVPTDEELLIARDTAALSRGGVARASRK